jgi:hypothetical protein
MLLDYTLQLARSAHNKAANLQTTRHGAHSRCEMNMCVLLLLDCALQLPGSADTNPRTCKWHCSVIR